MWIEPREKECSRTTRRVKKFPGEVVLKSFVASFANCGLIPPPDVSSCVTASVSKF